MGKIITISGKAEAGKDLLASILKEQLELHNKKVLIVHYADYLKFIAKQYFGWDGEKDEKGRTLLQYIGTDIVRKKDPNFWVDTAMRLINMFEYQFDYFLIPDTRFENEINLPKEKGFKTIATHIERLNYNSLLTEEQKNHISETALDNYNFDVYLKAKSGKEYMEKEVLRKLKKLLGGSNE